MRKLLCLSFLLIFASKCVSYESNSGRLQLIDKELVRPNGYIYYRFVDEFEEKEKLAWRAVMEQIESKLKSDGGKSCITFKNTEFSKGKKKDVENIPQRLPRFMILPELMLWLGLELNIQSLDEVEEETQIQLLVEDVVEIARAYKCPVNSLTLMEYIEHTHKQCEMDLANLKPVPGQPGIPGRPGYKGVKGYLGLPGLDGMPGLKGERGESGLPGGERGEQGIQGPPGPAGGEKGDPGVPGFPGSKGRYGIPGRPGAKGRQGDMGYNGLPGLDGLEGNMGNHGAKGAEGRPGFPGPPGIKGEPGECN